MHGNLFLCESRNGLVVVVDKLFIIIIIIIRIKIWNQVCLDMLARKMHI